MKRGKKYQDNLKSFDKAELFDLDAAVAQVKKMATANFDESIEMHIKLGVDSRHADQQVRGAIVLPNGTGNTVKVLVVAKGDKLKEAEEAGADFFGEDEIIDKIQKENWFDFDVMIATPDMMGKVGRLGRVLGPKGLMPNPKSGTVTWISQKLSRIPKLVKLNTVWIRQTLSTSSLVRLPLQKNSSCRT